LAGNIIPEMVYNVLSGTLNSRYSTWLEKVVFLSIFLSLHLFTVCFTPP